MTKTAAARICLKKKKEKKDKSQKKQIVVMLYDRLTYVSSLITEEKM